MASRFVLVNTTDIHLDWIEHRNRRPNQKLKPEVRHVLRPGAMNKGKKR